MQTPQLSPIESTIVLIFFLGLLLGMARVPFPKVRKLRLFPWIAGILSGVMDSFLVLLMISVLPLEGKKKHKLQFKALVMLAALIGGLLIYFGEVYALPHFIKYDIHSLIDTLYLAPPIVVFLGILSYLTSLVDVKVKDKKKVIRYLDDHQENLEKSVLMNVVEFGIGIVLLLLTHNPILCLGILLIYGFVSGQGNRLVGVWRNETEIGVMLLLVFAWLIYEPATGFFTGLDTRREMLGVSSINAILAGALLPMGGNRPLEIVLISAGALVTPLSSLVGVMLFKNRHERKIYMRYSIPLALIWLLLGLGYITLFPI